MTRPDTVTTYELMGERLSPKRTRIDTGDAEFVVGKDVNPVEYFLGAVLGCLNSTATMVARDLDLEIDDMEMTVRGDVDYASYRGEPSEARPGLTDLDVTITVDADADDKELETWLAAVEDRCPVTDNVAHATPLNVSVEST